jgi:hypothetical protein
MMTFLLILILELAIAVLVWLMLDWWQGPDESDGIEEIESAVARGES